MYMFIEFILKIANVANDRYRFELKSRIGLKFRVLFFQNRSEAITKSLTSI